MEAEGKRAVFVSHVHEDAPVAEYLQQRLLAGFLNQIEVYVSSARVEPPTISARRCQRCGRLDGQVPVTEETKDAIIKIDRDRDIRARLRDALTRKQRWRSISQIAAEAAVSEDAPADILRADPTVRFTRRRETGDVMVGLIERVGRYAPARKRASVRRTFGSRARSWTE